jgi:hypothetical protein
MKAKLIKTRDNGFLTYVLKREDKRTIAMSKYPFPSESTYLAESHGIELQKLSPENCDEIFGVVNVEKLAEEDCSIHHPYHPVHDQTTRYTFIRGFNKAMELSKDKLFTLEDMKGYFDWHKKQGYVSHKPEDIDEYIQSLQQPTEIEVEIETETKVWDFISNGEFESFEIIPKLDSQGCLILKKI